MSPTCVLRKYIITVITYENEQCIWICVMFILSLCIKKQNFVLTLGFDKRQRYIDPGFWLSTKETDWFKSNKECFIWGGKHVVNSFSDWQNLLFGSLVSSHFYLGNSWWDVRSACQIALFARYSGRRGNIILCEDL